MATKEQEKELKYGTVIERQIFEQILEMDDGSDEFSRAIVFDFFEQANNTFSDMEDAITKKDLKTLSELGHFLKGSSATLGLLKVKEHCEAIQHYGAHKDATGDEDVPDSELCLKRIKNTMPGLKKDFAEAKAVLIKFYDSYNGGAS